MYPPLCSYPFSLDCVQEKCILGQTDLEVVIISQFGHFVKLASKADTVLGGLGWKGPN